jgi:hypothetical protein
MRRRDFIALVGGAAFAGPMSARAQRPMMPVIGFLHPASLNRFASLEAAFRQGRRPAMLKVKTLPLNIAGPTVKKIDCPH